MVQHNVKSYDAARPVKTTSVTRYANRVCTIAIGCWRNRRREGRGRGRHITHPQPKQKPSAQRQDDHMGGSGETTFHYKASCE